ncbi:hypothetical protein ACYT6H_10615, partial [Streptococcus pyogenes]
MLKANARGLPLVLVGFPGYLVAFTVQGKSILQVEIVLWDTLPASAIKWLTAKMPFKIQIEGF